MNQPSLPRRALGGLLASLLWLAPAIARAQAEAAVFQDGFETDANADGWPDGWSKPKAGQWVAENGNHFLRLEQVQPGATQIAYRRIPLPAGLTSCKLTFRARFDRVTRGDQPWKDARLVIRFIDAQGAKMKSKPGDPHFAGTSADWKDVSLPIVVPPGAAAMEIMPSLMMIAGGRFDIDDLKLVPIP